MNVERIHNEKFDIKLREQKSSELSRRCGILGYKVGMTSEYDKWGVYQTLTVIHIDRCQVVDIKTKQNDGFDAILVGSGQKSYNNKHNFFIHESILANVPLKRDYA